MAFDSEIAVLRFGTGLRPGGRLPVGPGQLLDELAAPDRLAQTYPIGTFQDQLADIRGYLALRQIVIRGNSEAERARAKDDLRKLRLENRARQTKWLAHSLTRASEAEFGFRERLTRFWADHFTVVGKNVTVRAFAATFVEDAIRPHVGGRFEDMLRAAVTHPMMLYYLDQFSSIGEGSIIARRQGKGLNENLAREVLELHTLGVDGGYTQKDVREFAKILAGFTFNRNRGAIFQPRRGSPGAETVLGRSYGGKRPRIEDVRAVLGDLATHPDTARHLARKLAVHFVADNPDPGLVDQVAQAFTDSGGDLARCYAALLDHPAAWQAAPRKTKQPYDFVATSLRALAADPVELSGMKPKAVLQAIARPMQVMGQTWERPPGPDGWPEDGAHWITPQGLAARIQWAMTVPQGLLGGLPDPRDFARAALGGQASDATLFAAKAAESRWEGVGLVLASADFQKR